MQTNNEREKDDIEKLILQMQQEGMAPEQEPMQPVPVQAADGDDDIAALIQSAQAGENAPAPISIPEPKKDKPSTFKDTLEQINKMQIEMGLDPDAPREGNPLDYAEPITRGAVSMLGTSLNGLYSGAQAIFGGDSVSKDADQFNARQKLIDDFAQPKTEEGKTAMAGLQWLGEKLMIPVSGYAGLAELIMNQDLDAAVDSIAKVQSGEKSMGDVLADSNYEATGDPAWAAAVKTATDALPMLIGGRYTQKPLIQRRLDKQASELQEQMRAITMDQPRNGQLQDVNGAQMAEQQLMAIDEISQQRRRIDYDEMKMIESEMRENPAYARKIAQGIKSKPDEAAAGVIKQGASKGAVANLKATTPETRKVMRNMLGNANTVLNDEGLAAELRPSMAMGDLVNRRISFLNNKRKQVGGEINAAVKNFGNEVIPLDESAPIANRFVSNLEELGIELDDATLAPLFDNSSVRDIPSFRKVIVDTMRDLSTREMTPRELHFFKKRLDENISYGQKQEGLSAGVEIALQGLRADINGYLGRINPEYKAANQNYAVLKSALDNSEQAFKIKKKLQLNPRLQEEYDIQKIGQELRKTLSNYAAGIDIRQTLTNIEDVTSKYGLNDNVQVNRLISFDNMLNGMMPTLIPGGMKSTIAQGIDSARLVAEPKAAILERGAQVVGGVIDDMRGINESNASRAITRMLNELDASNRKKTGTNITTTDGNTGNE